MDPFPFDLLCITSPLKDHHFFFPLKNIKDLLFPLKNERSIVRTPYITIENQTERLRALFTSHISCFHFHFN